MNIQDDFPGLADIPPAYKAIPGRAASNALYLTPREFA